MLLMVFEGNCREWNCRLRSWALHLLFASCLHVVSCEPVHPSISYSGSIDGDAETEAPSSAVSMLQTGFRLMRKAQGDFTAWPSGEERRLLPSPGQHFVFSENTSLAEHAAIMNEFRPIWDMVTLNLDKADADPVWPSAHELIRRHLLLNPEIRRLVDVCSSGDMKRYVRQSCQENSTSLDANTDAIYFCGTRKKGIEWEDRSYVNRCDENHGTAYHEKGICGLSKKKQVMNFFDVVFNFEHRSAQLNAPSIDCILGLADCNLYYCQHCGNLCAPMGDQPETSK